MFSSTQPDWIVDFMMRHCASLFFSFHLFMFIIVIGSSGSILIVHSPDVLNSRQNLLYVQVSVSLDQYDNVYFFCRYVIEKLIERIKHRSLRVLPLYKLHAEAEASMHEATSLVE